MPHNEALVLSRKQYNQLKRIVKTLSDDGGQHGGSYTPPGVIDLPIHVIEQDGSGWMTSLVDMAKKYFRSDAGKAMAKRAAGKALDVASSKAGALAEKHGYGDQFNAYAPMAKQFASSKVNSAITGSGLPSYLHGSGMRITGSGHPSNTVNGGQLRMSG